MILPRQSAIDPFIVGSIILIITGSISIRSRALAVAATATTAADTNQYSAMQS